MAVTNTAVAGGHMDFDGTYLGPPPGTGPPPIAPKKAESEKKLEPERIPQRRIEPERRSDRGRSGWREDPRRVSRGRDDGWGRMKEIEYEPLSAYMGASSLPAAGVPVKA